FAKLDSIRPSIVWYQRSNEPAEMLSDGRAVMSTALNSPIFTAITEDKREIGIIWDGQRYEVEVLSILKGTRHRREAIDFIRFATGSKPIGQEASMLPYGPARKSALKFVPKNPDSGVDMMPYLATAESNFGNALPNDPSWWAAHGEALQA